MKKERDKYKHEEKIYAIPKTFTKKKLYEKNNAIGEPKHTPVYQPLMLKTEVISVKIPAIFP